MLYADAVIEVVQSSKRPDKINVARRKVNEAITFYCLDNEFSRDFKEQTVVIDPNQFTQAIPISTLERFRREKYIKRTGTRGVLSVVKDSDIFNFLHNYNLCNSYYIVGDNINISMTVKAANIDIGYFQYPPILNETGINSFWLLDVNPWMIIDRALSEMFRDIGDEKSSREHAITARDSYMAFRKDQLKVQ